MLLVFYFDVNQYMRMRLKCELTMRKLFTLLELGWKNALLLPHKMDAFTCWNNDRGRSLQTKREHCTGEVESATFIK